MADPITIAAIVGAIGTASTVYSVYRTGKGVLAVRRKWKNRPRIRRRR